MEAAGAMGWSEQQFWYSTPAYFSQAWKGFDENRLMAYRAGWEQAQILATYIFAPHSKNRVSPQEIIPLPWLEKATKTTKWATVDPELLEKFNNDANQVLAEKYGWRSEQ